jgi:putative transposase
MIDRGHRLALRKQAALLGISRGSVYYEAAAGVGCRPCTDAAARRTASGVPFHRRADVAQPAGCRREQDRPAPPHNIDAVNGDRSDLSQAQYIQTCGRSSHPYLLRGLTIDRPNQVWASDITYIPMAHGFVYLAAVMDWFTRPPASAWRPGVCQRSARCSTGGEFTPVSRSRLTASFSRPCRPGLLPMRWNTGRSSGAQTAA